MSTYAMKRPAFSLLSERECNELLQRSHVGRLCFINGGQPDIEPVHYVSDDGWIFLRSAMGTKLEAFAHNPYVAFEIDEIRDTFDWRSVVARGTIYVLPPDGPRVERKSLERAVKALRSVAPQALTDDDPTPARQIVYGIHVDRLTGRMSEPDAELSTRTLLRPPSPKARAPRARSGF